VEGGVAVLERELGYMCVCLLEGTLVCSRAERNNNMHNRYFDQPIQFIHQISK